MSAGMMGGQHYQICASLKLDWILTSWLDFLKLNVEWRHCVMKRGTGHCIMLKMTKNSTMVRI
jgi:hypothetical protein